MELPINEIVTGDCLEVMKNWPDKSIQCCVTSPPYWGLRDYGVKGQLGLEKTPEEYVSKMVEVFQEVKRVLRDDGTLFLNLGDSYWGGKGKSSQAWSTENSDRHCIQGPEHQICGRDDTRPSDGKHDVIKRKDLCGIPWRVAFALQADGWYLRQDIIWHKPNPMPESCQDRCTKAHEYIFLLTKNPRYFYDADAIREATGSELSWEEYAQRTAPGKTWRSGMPDGMHAGSHKHDGGRSHPGGRNKRSVWTVTTKSFSEAHFATFPPKLIEPCILAGTSKKGACPECGAPWEPVVEDTPEYKAAKQDKSKWARGWGYKGFKGEKSKGSHTIQNAEIKTTGWRPTCPFPRCMPQEAHPCVVFDPFMGAGTVAVVAAQHGRNYVGSELNPDYVKIGERHIAPFRTGVPEKEAAKGQIALFA